MTRALLELENVETYYGPDNAVLVVAGDVDPEHVYERVQFYFGDIEPGPPLVQPQLDVARRDQESRWVMEDRVPQARLYMIWNGPAFGDHDLEYLTIAADVMATGKSSRLVFIGCELDHIAPLRGHWLSRGGYRWWLSGLEGCTLLTGARCRASQSQIIFTANP